MAAKKTGLGRGLDALFPDKSPQEKPKTEKKLNDINESSV